MRWLVTTILILFVAIGGLWLFGGDRVRQTLRLPPIESTPPPGPSISELTKYLHGETLREIKITAPNYPTMIFARGEDGVWGQPGNWPIRQGETAGLVHVLASLNTLYAPIPASTEEDLAHFGLDKGNAPIEIVVQVKTVDESKSITLHVGREPLSSGKPDFALSTFVRVDDQPEVLKFAPNLYRILAAGPDEYRGRRLVPDCDRVKLGGDRELGSVANRSVPIVGDRYASLRFESGDASNPKHIAYVLKRVEKNPLPRREPDRSSAEPSIMTQDLAASWMMEAELRDPKLKEGSATVLDRVEPVRLRSILVAIPELWVETFIAKDKAADSVTGLSKPDRSLTITGADGKAMTILFGKITRTMTRTEPPPPPMFGQPPPPPKIVTEEYRYAKLKDNELVFEIRTDKLSDLFVDPRELRDPLAARFDVGDVSSLIIEQPGQPKIELTKKKGNKDAEREEDKRDRWFLGNAPAESMRVTELVEQLAKLDAKGDESFVDNPDPAKVKELGLASESAIKVTLVAQPAGEGDRLPPARTHEIFIGKDDLERKKIPVRTADRPRVGIVDDGIAKLIVRPAQAYRGRRLFDSTDWKLEELTVTGLDSSFSLRKSGKAEWRIVRPVDSLADENKAGQLADDLARLETIEYVDDAPKPEDLDKKFGLAKPRFIVDLGFVGNQAKPRKLEIGSGLEGKLETYARLDGGSVFTLSKTIVDGLEQGALGFLPPKLWSTTPDHVVAVEIQRGKEEPYRLTMEGGIWKVAGPFEATAGSMEPLVPMAAEVRADKAVSLEIDPVKYGFDNPPLRITVTTREFLLDKARDTVKKLVFGKETAPGSASRYAMIDGDPVHAVYVLPITLFAEADRPALDRLDKALLAVDPSQVNRATIKRSSDSGTTTLVKNDKGAWKAEGESFNVDLPVTNAFLEAASRPSVVRLAAYGKNVKWSDFGLDKPEFIIVLASAGKDAKPHTLEIGKAEANGDRYVRVDAGPAVGVIPTRQAEALVRERLDFTDHSLLSFDPQSMNGFVRTVGKEETEVARNGTAFEIVKPAKQKADRKTIEELADQFGRLRALKVAAFAPTDPERFGLKEPTARIAFSVGDKPKVLKIGAPVDPAKPEGDRYAAAESEPMMVGIVPGTVVEKLLAPPLKFRDRALAKFVDADKLVFTRGDRKATFAKQDGSWKLVEPVKAEAEQGELDDLVNALAGLRADDYVAEKPEDLTPFGLKSPEATWKAYSGDREVLSLNLGDFEKNGKRVHAMTEKGELVALLDPSTSARVLAEYRKRSLWTDADASQIESIIVSSGTSNFQLRKVGGVWRDAAKPDDPIDSAKVTELAAVLGGLKAERFVADSDAKLELYGLEKPSWVIVFTQKGSTVKSLRIGGPEGTSGGKRVYAKNGDTSQSAVFTLSEADTAVLTRDRSALLKKK